MATLTRRRINGLPVVDDDGKVVGVVPRADLTRRQAVRPGRARVISLWRGRART